MILDTLFSIVLPILLVLIIVYLIGKRLIHTAKAHLGMKKFVKESIKKDRKKFNGLKLVEQVKRKRKRHSNSFQQLRMRGKRLVRQYFTHKTQELPVFVRYARGKLLKRSRSSLRILVKQDKRTLGKYPIKQGVKHLIECANEHECLNELITFLHHVPDAILEQRPYAIDVPSSDTFITYQIK
jgi:hypothetical protein